MPADALVFDLDGTLWDTTGTCADAWNRVLARLGIAHRGVTAGDVRAVSGHPHLDAIRRAFATLDEPEVRHVAEETAREDNAAVAAHGGVLYPGGAEGVPALRRRLPLVIVSNCQQGYVEASLAWSGLAADFVDFECWGDTGRTKGENLAAVVARNRLLAPWFVGNTDGDRSAADANGVPFVYASYGYGEAARWAHRIDRFVDPAALLQ